ncbi:hypothetical protein BT96DRAFT_305033 [Gymnopus androsaceus JB14]|uniref:Uncharacterized protein n=1 Tax=Gymnopus androsaceus JB14 TaxID=1447944 RepID=A0A6A4IAN8_9AGAR|nr:hypothetical protein BT96DRAFT_305033 [Gymnopus androsaceus JB14]
MATRGPTLHNFSLFIDVHFWKKSLAKVKWKKDSHFSADFRGHFTFNFTFNFSSVFSLPKSHCFRCNESSEGIFILVQFTGIYRRHIFWIGKPTSDAPGIVKSYPLANQTQPSLQVKPLTPRFHGTGSGTKPAPAGTKSVFNSISTDESDFEGSGATKAHGCEYRDCRVAVQRPKPPIRVDCYGFSGKGGCTKMS